MMRNVVRYLNKQGGIAVIATDTVYGVVARAADPLAVARLYDLKRREGKPGTVIAASVDQLVDMGIDRQYFTAVENLWPGAVSVYPSGHR
jgi:L-threonylcarbamoyladenylate synthase